MAEFKKYAGYLPASSGAQLSQAEYARMGMRPTNELGSGNQAMSRFEGLINNRLSGAQQERDRVPTSPPPNASEQLIAALDYRGKLGMMRSLNTAGSMIGSKVGATMSGPSSQEQMKMWEMEQELDRYIQNLSPAEANYYYYGEG